jgi:two-component system response regulator
LEFFNGYTRTASIPGPEWDLPYASGSSSATADAFGSNPSREKAPDSFSQFQRDRASDPDRPAVVVVEDNAGDVFLVREVVTTANPGVNLYFMNDGDAALRFFEQIEAGSIRCPEVLLLDLNIPNTNGLEVLSWLRNSQRCTAMRVVVMTSSSARADRERSESLNIDRYFNKPSTYSEFLKLGDIVRKLLQPSA